MYRRNGGNADQRILMKYVHHNLATSDWYNLLNHIKMVVKIPKGEMIHKNSQHLTFLCLNYDKKIMCCQNQNFRKTIYW